MLVKMHTPVLLTKLEGLCLVGVMTVGMYYQDYHWTLATDLAPN